MKSIKTEKAFSFIVYWPDQIAQELVHDFPDCRPLQTAPELSRCLPWNFLTWNLPAKHSLTFILFSSKNRAIAPNFWIPQKLSCIRSHPPPQVQILKKMTIYWQKRSRKTSLNLQSDFSSINDCSGAFQMGPFRKQMSESKTQALSLSDIFAQHKDTHEQGGHWKVVLFVLFLRYQGNKRLIRANFGICMLFQFVTTPRYLDIALFKNANFVLVDTKAIVLILFVLGNYIIFNA